MEKPRFEGEIWKIRKQMSILTSGIERMVSSRKNTVARKKWINLFKKAHQNQNDNKLFYKESKLEAMK